MTTTNLTHQLLHNCIPLPTRPRTLIPTHMLTRQVTRTRLTRIVIRTQGKYRLVNARRLLTRISS